jgi:hypothetical protein
MATIPLHASHPPDGAGTLHAISIGRRAAGQRKGALQGLAGGEAAKGSIPWVHQQMFLGKL